MNLPRKITSYTIQRCVEVIGFLYENERSIKNVPLHQFLNENNKPEKYSRSGRSHENIESVRFVVGDSKIYINCIVKP